MQIITDSVGIAYSLFDLIFDDKFAPFSQNLHPIA